jgi:hypothetical protein
MWRVKNKYKNKNKYIVKNCASRWSFIKNHENWTVYCQVLATWLFINVRVFLLDRKQSNSKALEIIESLLVLQNTSIISVGLSGLVPSMQGHGILFLMESPIGRIITVTRWSQVVRYIYSVCATWYMMFSRRWNWESEKKNESTQSLVVK